MSTTHTASRAERLISEAEHGSLAWAARNGHDELSGAIHQIDLLENIIRSLCAIGDNQAAAVKHMGAEVARMSTVVTEQAQSLMRLRAASRAQGERIEQLQFDAAKGDDDFDAKADELQRRITAFHNRSTGAAEALRGGL